MRTVHAPHLQGAVGSGHRVTGASFDVARAGSLTTRRATPIDDAWVEPLIEQRQDTSANPPDCPPWRLHPPNSPSPRGNVSVQPRESFGGPGLIDRSPQLEGRAAPGAVHVPEMDSRGMFLGGGGLEFHGLTLEVFRLSRPPRSRPCTRSPSPSPPSELASGRSLSATVSSTSCRRWTSSSSGAMPTTK